MGLRSISLCRTMTTRLARPHIPSANLNLTARNQSAILQYSPAVPAMPPMPVAAAEAAAASVAEDTGASRSSYDMWWLSVVGGLFVARGILTEGEETKGNSLVWVDHQILNQLPNICFF